MHPLTSNLTPSNFTGAAGGSVAGSTGPPIAFRIFAARGCLGTPGTSGGMTGGRSNSSKTRWAAPTPRMIEEKKVLWEGKWAYASDMRVGKVEESER